MGVVASDSIQLASLKTVKDAATEALAQAASATSSAQSAQASATAAGESAARAQAAADAAQGDIDEMSEYFWHDALGAHILSDTSDVSGVRYRTDLKGAGMTINRLNTDGTETELSKFTATGVQIGDNSSSHTLLTADQQLFYNKKNTMIGAIGTHYDGLVKTDAEVKIYTIPSGYDDYEVRVPLGGVPLDDTRSYVTIDGENYYQLFYLSVYVSSEEKPTSYTNLVGSEIIYHIPVCEYTIDLYSAGLSSDPTGTLTVTYSESMPNMLTLRLQKTVTDSYYYHVFGIYMYKGTAPYYRFGMDDSEDNNSYESMGILSEAAGFNTYAPGLYAQAGNKDTVAAGNYQTVFGNRNEIDQSSQYAFIIGNGTRERPETSVMPPVADKRRNAFAVDWAGGVVSGLGNEHGPTFNIDVTDLETEGVVQNLMGHGLKRHQSQGGAGVAFADYMIVGNYNEPHVASSATDWPPIFSIGNGTSDTDRLNAFQINNSGQIFRRGSNMGCALYLTDASSQIGQAPSTDKYTAPFLLKDSDDSNTCYIQNVIYANGNLRTDYMTTRLDASGTRLYNGFYQHIYADGTYGITFTNAATKAAWLEGLGAASETVNMGNPTLNTGTVAQNTSCKTDRQVSINLRLTGCTFSASGTQTLGTIPSGFRPSAEAFCIVLEDGVYRNARITTAGTITIYSGAVISSKEIKVMSTYRTS